MSFSIRSFLTPLSLILALCGLSPTWLQASEITIATKAVCSPGATNLCLSNNRFRVEVQWRDFENRTGPGQVVPFGSSDSGLFWFFGSNNWEMLVKIVDGCSLNQRFWVFSAATTTVEYTLTVTDTNSGQVKRYFNPAGTPAAALTDTNAFATCSGLAGLPPDPGEAGRRTLEGIDSDLDGLRDDLQRYIALNYAGTPQTMAALRQGVVAVQEAILTSTTSSALDQAVAYARSVECLHSTRPNDAGQVGLLMLAQILNTEARGLAYLTFSDRLGGEAFPAQEPSQWASSCTLSAATGAALGKRARTPKTKAACGEGDTTIYFGNGVWNDFAGAQQSLDTLIIAVKGFLPPSELNTVSFSLAFNPSEGQLADLWEAVRQDIQTDFSRFLRILGGIELMPDFFQNALRNRVAQADRDAVLNNSVLQRHVNHYQREILEGNKVVLVAHSQGNFYANQAYVNLSPDEQRSFGIVAVATPDGFIAGNGPYTTSIKDTVIDAYILLVGPAKFPNINNPFNGDDKSGHMFTTSYLRTDFPSRNVILGNIRSVRNALETPENTAGDGIITVTLTWGDEPDVDLHVFEPNGTHVFYGNKQGPSGFLDVDDVSGRGPEHYFVACDTLEAGTYSVGLNYYSGSNPERAEVQIKAGLFIRTYEVFLNNAVGSSGNNSPILVTNISVTGSDSEGYDFLVQP